MSSHRALAARLRPRPWTLTLLGLAMLASCSRGRAGATDPSVQAPAVPSQASPSPLPKPAHPAMAMEQALQIQLPERQIGEVLPGWTRLPFRKLTEFTENQQLVVAISAQGVRLLERRLTADQVQTDERLTELLRWATDQWQRRSGLAANRLVLAADRSAAPMLVAQVRKVALGLQPWRVVALARDGDHLVELSLNPPPDRRPSGQPMPIASGATATTR